MRAKEVSMKKKRLNNKIFASKYTLYIPKKEKLIKEVECVLEKEKDIE
jgi:hypothetical protein